ncbi:hypothetical protein ACWGIB_15025 [Streptomyces xiamenensis]
MAERTEPSGVTGALREAAGAHRPDRERMRARVSAGIAEGGGRLPERTPRRVPWPAALPARARAAGAAAVLAVAAGAVVLAVAWWGPLAGPDPVPPAGEAPPPAAVTAGPLSALGEVDPGSHAYWSQSNVTVRAEEPLTAFALELRVTGGEGVRSTGAWRTLPGEDFELTVSQEAGELIHRWELRAGAEVPAGTHVFAAQYDHPAGEREPARDRYLVRATGAGGTVSAEGAFQ